MKFKWQLIAMLMAVATPTWALAQEDGKDRPGSRRPKMTPTGEGSGQGGFMGGPMAMLPIMKALDTDQDGILSATEIANASKSLMQLDKDGNGVLSMEEMRPDLSRMAPGGLAGIGGPGSNGAPSGAMMAKLFEKSDSDNDGKLTGDEIPERMRDRLKQIDSNGDGSIQKSEMVAAMQRMEGLGQRKGKEGKEEGGGGVKPKRPGE